ncbi:DUF72 domain-containing protein [Peribacillus psychrosaccharolyticus]|uniref:DUF72 domain-containing protein n=1 Tax=Peribacillus psychrosaccharolyticus TaxID=1407 RepID=A0A974NK90_PERPY|nr:DUF72 domain-containing protein [Peribacillus psychrosaccharolyticus]MEC2055636.1 DUF72 domain-containing protein [Peribacillus psychrosaccharolyticus]MED3743337.1 DUF72 domain-containing protein [Peribacillus psychrosaccharolyticus]QQS99297.1 DUF72 domain-containing protein [Peribacillus psychrosaccharolyticus]
MIYIGVTGWGDHDRLYGDKLSPRNKLLEYGSHFPTVEVDASFYAVQPERNSKKWVADTPQGFQFVVKAYQGMTTHTRGEIPFQSRKEMFDAFHASLAPYQSAGKLAMVLFQFPPWFDCTRENVEYLRWCRAEMDNVPVSLEFRNQSWFTGKRREQTLDFMERESWIHAICDEPQSGEGSVPLVLQATNQEKTLVRFHGRNVYGWKKPSSGNWREVRYLYKYNRVELQEWVTRLRMLEKQSKDIFVLFNNNSGGDAAGNAKEMIELLNIEYEGLAPKQLDFF